VLRDNPYSSAGIQGSRSTTIETKSLKLRKHPTDPDALPPFDRRNAQPDTSAVAHRQTTGVMQLSEPDIPWKCGDFSMLLKNTRKPMQDGQRSSNRAE
jgi:hypothetical protein